MLLFFSLFFWLLSYSNFVKLTFLKIYLNLPGTHLLQRKCKLDGKLQSSPKYKLNFHSLMWPTVLDFGASWRSGRLRPLYRRKSFPCSVASVMESLLISRIDEVLGWRGEEIQILALQFRRKRKLYTSKIIWQEFDNFDISVDKVNGNLLRKILKYLGHWKLVKNSFSKKAKIL